MISEVSLVVVISYFSNKYFSMTTDDYVLANKKEVIGPVGYRD